jgi:hypothetical protein
MTKFSEWLRGHVQDAGAHTSEPDPAVLNADIEALETWVNGVHWRRK